jgi:hypothetical protein
MTILHALLCAVFLGQQAAPPAVSLERLAEEMLAAPYCSSTDGAQPYRAFVRPTSV